MQQPDRPDNENLNTGFTKSVDSDLAYSSVASPSESEDVHRTDQPKLVDGQEPSAVVSRATGPRTEQGKQRTSRNAMKHGIFSKVILLNNESRAEYEELLGGMRETLDPKGTLEDVLVERLAITVWRQRREVLAECAEIRKNTEFIEIHQRERDKQEAERLICQSDPLKNYGLIEAIHNPKVLEYCLEALAQLRERFRQHGESPEDDEMILEKIYGDREKGRLQEDTYDWYLKCLDAFPDSDEEPAHERNSIEAQKDFLEKIDKEILRLEQYQKAETSVASTRLEIEVLRQNVPDSEGFNRLLRYDASLERTLYRTLSELERFQQMRLGQPTLPALKVDVSSL